MCVYTDVVRNKRKMKTNLSKYSFQALIFSIVVISLFDFKPSDELNGLVKITILIAYLLAIPFALSYLKKLIDILFPLKNESNWSQNKKEWWALVFILLTVTIFITSNILTNDYTQNFNEFLKNYGLIGITIGISLSIIFMVIVNNSQITKRLRFWGIICITLNSMFLSIGLTNYYNYEYGSVDLNCNNYSLIKKEVVMSGYKNQFANFEITVNENELTTTYVIDEDLWNSINVNDDIEFCLVKGALGYDVIYSFEKADKTKNSSQQGI